MQGQYTDDEMREKIASGFCDLRRYAQGIIRRKVGNTVNYYRRELDGSWTNYDCRTIYTFATKGA